MKTFGPRNNEMNSLGYYTVRNFVIHTSHLVLWG